MLLTDYTSTVHHDMSSSSLFDLSFKKFH